MSPAQGHLVSCMGGKLNWGPPLFYSCSNYYPYWLSTLSGFSVVSQKWPLSHTNALIQWGRAAPDFSKLCPMSLELNSNSPVIQVTFHHISIGLSQYPSCGLLFSKWSTLPRKIWKLFQLHPLYITFEICNWNFRLCRKETYTTLRVGTTSWPCLSHCYLFCQYTAPRWHPVADCINHKTASMDCMLPGDNTRQMQATSLLLLLLFCLCSATASVGYQEGNWRG